MPYTPPSQQSPASSRTTSPSVSRTSSYHEELPRSSMARQSLPRSMSSASYLHKHRRSPSLPNNEASATPSNDAQPDSDISDFNKSRSVKQSPPPLNNLRIPTGAVISPPDSSENSDGDENSAGAERGRELEKNWQQLQIAVRSLPQPRDGSPEKTPTTELEVPPQSASEPVTQLTSPTALSQEARKISHSRSATETKILLKAPTFADSPNGSSDDSEEDDDHLAKPALVRKKSGELVKPALRASSRRRYSSMPGTPTYSKSVHFNDNDNQTRHFLQVDKPIAVSTGTSPVETYDSETEFPFDSDAKPELQIRIASLPEETFERRALPIRVERLVLSQDKDTLIGTCAVQNISFQKLVVARFTLDYWKTTSEVVAEYNNASHNDGCDRFSFYIRLADQANIASKTMLLCVRYNVGGQEFWDNNYNCNYQIDFSESKPIKSRPVKSSTQSKPVVQSPKSAPPRSRHTSPLPRSKSHDSIDDDFISRIDKDAYDFGVSDKYLGESPTSIRLKPRPKRSPMFSLGAPTSPNNALGSRYDFGTSLSAALSSAQDKLGRQSGLMGGAMGNPAAAPSTARQTTNGSYFGVFDRKEPAKQVKPERPDNLTTDRPAIGSDQYKDLVQKFCYFTPGTGKAATSPQPRIPQSSRPQNIIIPSRTADGTSEMDSTSTSTWSSAACSPIVPTQLDGVNEQRESRTLNALSSLPAYSGTMKTQSMRSASPVSFRFPYQSHRDGYLSETSTPTAIQG